MQSWRFLQAQEYYQYRLSCLATDGFKASFGRFETLRLRLADSICNLLVYRHACAGFMYMVKEDSGVHYETG